MDVKIETREDFENYLISIIKKAKKINIFTLASPDDIKGLKLTSKDKKLLKKIYSKSPDYGIVALLAEIIENNPNINCVKKPNAKQASWVCFIKENDVNINDKNEIVNDSCEINNVTSVLGSETQEVFSDTLVENNIDLIKNKEVPTKSDINLDSSDSAAEEIVIQENLEASINDEKKKIENVSLKKKSVKKSNSVIQDESDDLPDGLDDSDNGSKPKKSSVNKELKKIIEDNMVKITDDFCISRYEVTQNIYEKIMDENPSTFKDENRKSNSWEGLPVESVSFNEAIEFCNKLSIECGRDPCYDSLGNYDNSKNGYRLPTEDEWNYTANGAANKPKNKFAGTDLAYGFAWYNLTSKNEDSELVTHEVGKKGPLIIDGKEIFDMTGNVWEWCWSLDKSDKGVCYGGSYEDSEVFLELGKLHNKDILDKDDRKSSIGFRISVNLKK